MLTITVVRGEETESRGAGLCPLVLLVLGWQAEGTAGGTLTVRKNQMDMLNLNGESPFLSYGLILEHIHGGEKPQKNIFSK